MQVAEPRFMLRVADNLYRTGQETEGRQMFRDALAVQDRVGGMAQSLTQKSASKASFLSDAGSIYASLGRSNDALVYYLEAEVLWKRILDSDPDQDVSAGVNLVAICMTIGDLYAANPIQRREARREYESAVEILSKLNAKNQISREQLK